MQKKKGSLLRRIFWIGLAAIIVLYLVPGTIAGAVVPSEIVKGRASDPSSLDKIENLIYKQRKDFDNLNIRTEHTFVSDGNKLTGYLYNSASEKGLVLLAHGLHNLSDGHIASVVSKYVDWGYAVFALDLTGSGKSEGDGARSLYQSSHDVQAGYAYLKEKNLLRGQLVLSGYSWGAYGVASALAHDVPADKVVAFSGYDQVYDEMVAMAAKQVGPIAYATVPPFALGLRMAWGSEAYYRVSDNLTPEMARKCFFVQGERDGTVPMGISLYSKCKDKGAKGHTVDWTHFMPWYSGEAHTYAKEIEGQLPEIAKKSQEEQAAFIESVDKEKSSALDAAMFSAIETFLSE